jgi:hypothetical protein
VVEETTETTEESPAVVEELLRLVRRAPLLSGKQQRLQKSAVLVEEKTESSKESPPVVEECSHGLER